MSSGERLMCSVVSICCTLARPTAPLRTNMMPIFAAEPASGKASRPSSAVVFLCSRDVAKSMMRF